MYQYNQERALLIIESPVLRLVAMVPVGMTLISSIVLMPLSYRLARGAVLEGMGRARSEIDRMEAV